MVDVENRSAYHQRARRQVAYSSVVRRHHRQRQSIIAGSAALPHVCLSRKQTLACQSMMHVGTSKVSSMSRSTAAWHAAGMQQRTSPLEMRLLRQTTKEIANVQQIMPTMRIAIKDTSPNILHAPHSSKGYP